MTGVDAEEPDVPLSAVDAVEEFITAVFASYPGDTTTRAEREERLRCDIIGFLGDAIDAGDLSESDDPSDFIHEHFGAPREMRDRYLREDSADPVWADRTCASSILGVTLLFLALAGLIKYGEYRLTFHDDALSRAATQGISALLLAASATLGVLSYIANWLRGGNRHRVAAFVTGGAVVFFLAMAVRVDFSVIERSPIERSHILVTMAIPLPGLDTRPTIRRYILDIDRTRLPEHLRRSKTFVFAEDETSGTALFQFWAVILAVVFANSHILSRLAESLALISDDEATVLEKRIT